MTNLYWTTDTSEGVVTLCESCAHLATMLAMRVMGRENVPDTMTEIVALLNAEAAALGLPTWDVTASETGSCDQCVLEEALH